MPFRRDILFSTRLPLRNKILGVVRLVTPTLGIGRRPPYFSVIDATCFDP
jgi:hypothetical protein